MAGCWQLTDMNGDVLASGTETEMRSKAAKIVGNTRASRPHWSTYLYGPGDGSTSLMVRWLDEPAEVGEPVTEGQA